MRFSTQITPVRLIFIGIWFLCFIIFSLIWLVSYLTGNWSPDNQVEVTQFGICTTRRTPLEIKDTVHPDHGQLYGCGYLRTKIPIVVSVYVFEDGDQTAINVLNTRKRSEGLFFEPLEIDGKLTPGVYELRVYYGRSILGEEEFTVEQP